MTTEHPAGFGALLRGYRAARGLTQEALAEQAGLSARAISDLERGVNRLPQRETVARLAAALSLDGEAQAALQAATHQLDGRSVPVAAPPALPPLTLAGPHTPLVGREEDEAAVTRLLVQGGVRLLTLTGPGGVGKTRLAQQVAAGLRAHFAAGVAVVLLAPVSDAALVLPAVAQTLGVRESASQSLAALLAATLRERHLLLVLDNFEQVLPAAPEVAALLAACTRLSVLVTSRAPLRLTGESLYAVPPLALPDLAHLPPPAVMAVGGAAALLVQRAQAAWPAFRLTAANARAVAEICVRVDGLPLALELAAARLAVLSPVALLARLQQSLPVLTGGPRDLPARQQTLRATIAWSHDLLDGAAQVLFRRLSVFSGGATLEALEAVCAGDAALPRDRLLDALAALVDNSLLRRDEAMVGAGELTEPRYTMLETVREYAAEQLAASGEAGAVAGRHAAHYLALAEEAAPHLRRHEQLDWLALLWTEWDNLRAAVRHYLTGGVAEEALRVIAALVWAAIGSRVTEHRVWVTELLALPGITALRRVRAAALGYLGPWNVGLGPLAIGLRQLEESRALGQELGDQGIVAWATVWQGSFAYDGGDYARSRQLLEEGLALYQTLGDPWGIAEASIQLGRTVATHGDHRRARQLLEEALVLGRRGGDRWLLGFALEVLGEVALAEGKLGEARAAWEESLAHNQSLGNVGGVATINTFLGHLALRQLDYSAAGAHYAVALEHRGTGLLLLWAVQILGGLALMAAARGQAERCLPLLAATAALAVAEGVQSLYPEPEAMAQAAAQARAALSDRAGLVWAEGLGMSWDEATAYALDDPVLR